MSSTNSFSGLVEFTSGFAPRPQISHVLFDFDGTLSLIREGVVIGSVAAGHRNFPGAAHEVFRRLCDPIRLVFRAGQALFVTKLYVRHRPFETLALGQNFLAEL